MKKVIIAVLLSPALSWASFQPITGSTVVVQAANGNTTAIPVTGTVAATQSGTWTVQPGNTANTTAWKVDGSAVTQPVSLSGNQAVNVAQINGATPLMGNGATGTGSHRVTLANDSTAIAGWGQGATGSAVPSGAQYQGGIAKTALPSAASDGNLVGSIRDKFGRTVTISDCPRDLIISTGVVLTASTSETVLLSSGAASVFDDAVAIVLTNSSATGSLVTFRTNGNGTTSTLHFYVPPTDTRGFTLPHVWPQGTAAANWTVQSGASVSSIYVDAVFCQNK